MSKRQQHIPPSQAFEELFHKQINDVGNLLFIAANFKNVKLVLILEGISLISALNRPEYFP